MTCTDYNDQIYRRQHAKPLQWQSGLKGKGAVTDLHGESSYEMLADDQKKKNLEKGKSVIKCEAEINSDSQGAASNWWHAVN